MDPSRSKHLPPCDLRKEGRLSPSQHGTREQACGASADGRLEAAPAGTGGRASRSGHMRTAPRQASTRPLCGVLLLLSTPFKRKVLFQSPAGPTSHRGEVCLASPPSDRSQAGPRPRSSPAARDANSQKPSKRAALDRTRAPPRPAPRPVSGLAQGSFTCHGSFEVSQPSSPASR